MKNSITQHFSVQRSLFSIKAMVLALTAIVSTSTPAQDDELLPPEEAFAFSATLNEDKQIKAAWTVAEGYYMYRDKFAFELKDASGVQLGEAVFPKGKVKDDPLFGEVEVFFKQADFRVPVSGQGDFILVAKGQGCNEPVGVCYPPQSYETPLTLANALVAPAAAQSVADSNSGDELNSLGDLRSALGMGAEADEDELLPAEEAFQLALFPQENGAINAEFNVAPGYYLYRQKFKFSADTIQIIDAQIPEGEQKFDEYFGDVETYRHTFTIPLLTSASAADASKAVTLISEFQGCADLGVCYPPETRTHNITLPASLSAALVNTATAAEPDVAKPNASRTSPKEAPQGLWGILLGAFFAGLLLTFTPCVLPMIPILSSVIAGQGESLTRSRGGWLALVYVLGTALTYAFMGALAGATGDQLQAYFQNAWAIGILAAIFLVMSLSMFGLFEIQMPSFIQSRLQEKSAGIKGGSTPMVFVLGAVSALIVGACVSPVLISFLGIAISRGDPTLGAMMMFAMALGMGVPLILLGIGAGQLLPKAGMWMDKVKYVFGALLIAVAIYLLGILPEVPVLLLWAAFFIVASVYLGATQSLPEKASGWQKLFKGIGTLLLIWGVLALVGGFYGERDPLKPLPEQLFSATSTSSPSASAHVAFAKVSNESALDAAISQAATSGKGIMIDYYADWCTDCIRMEKTTFADPQVIAALDAKFNAVQVDVTDPNDEDGKALKKRYGVFGPPAVLFIDANGQQITDASFYGYKNSQEFLHHIESL